MDAKDVPEKAFLENDPTISPIDMISCTLTRTNAILECLHVSLEHTGCMTNEMITAVLWQVSGNLKQIERIAHKWHKAEYREKQRPGRWVPGVHCETKGLDKD